MRLWSLICPAVRFAPAGLGGGKKTATMTSDRDNAKGKCMRETREGGREGGKEGGGKEGRRGGGRKGGGEEERERRLYKFDVGQRAVV